MCIFAARPTLAARCLSRRSSFRRRHSSFVSSSTAHRMCNSAHFPKLLARETRLLGWLGAFVEVQRFLRSGPRSGALTTKLALLAGSFPYPTAPNSVCNPREPFRFGISAGTVRRVVDDLACKLRREAVLSRKKSMSYGPSSERFERRACPARKCILLSG